MDVFRVQMRAIGADFFSAYQFRLFCDLGSPPGGATPFAASVRSHSASGLNFSASPAFALSFSLLRCAPLRLLASTRLPRLPPLIVSFRCRPTATVVPPRSRATAVPLRCDCADHLVPSTPPDLPLVLKRATTSKLAPNDFLGSSTIMPSPPSSSLHRASI
jgi:hypothetical protein